MDGQKRWSIITAARHDMIKLDPEHTALLIIDPQNDFCHADGVLAQSGVDVSHLIDAGQNIKRLIEICQAAGVKDIWTQQINHRVDHGRAHKQIKSHTDKRKKYTAQPGSWGAEFIDELKPLINENSEVLTKYRFNCFRSTRLEQLLKILGINTLIICGGTTNACVDTTVRDAYMLDFDVVMVEDCIGAVRQDWHEMAIAVWKHYFGEVVSVADIEQSLA